MYTTSTAYKTEIQKRSRTFECRVTIGDRVFTNNEVQSIDLNGGIQDIFSIGNTPSVCLELVLRNTTDTIFTTNSVKVEIGIKIGSTIEYIPLGIFNIEDIKKDDYTTKFTCYDNMTKFEIAYFSSLGDKPTLQQVVNELASKTGVQFTGSLPSYTVKKLEGFTCREILGYVASLCGGNALITRDGKFTIVYVTDTSRDVGEGVFDLQRDETKYKVGKITCQIKEQETISKGSLGTDSMELSFENPWVTETILTDIYNRLNGFNYLGYTMKWQGDLSLDIGDIITYTDVKGVTRKLPILYRKLSYDGGLDSELSAKGETKNKNSFSSSGSMSNKVNRLVTEQAIIKEAIIEKANIEDLKAINAEIANLKVKDTEIENALIKKATIEQLNAANANIQNLIAEDARINNLVASKASITELNAVSAKIGTVEADTAIIKDLLAGNVTAGSGQIIHLTAKNVTIEDAVIKNLIAAKLSVSDLQAGTISTNKFTIASTDGGLNIVGPTIQWKDKNNKIRMQAGKDAQGNFTFLLVGEDGTTALLDQTGIKRNAIADNLIIGDMISENAVGEKQINYSSLITGINKDTNTQLIKASKVAIDLTGQSLEVAFNSLKSNVDNMEVGTRNLWINNNVRNYLGGNIGSTKFSIENYKITIESNPRDLVGCKIENLGKKIYISGETNLQSINAYYKFSNRVQENRVINVVNNKFLFSLEVPEGAEYLNLGLGKFPYVDGYYLSHINVVNDVNSDWTPAPEDIDQVTQSLQTQITVAQGKIEGLIKDTTITEGSSSTSLKDAYISLKATVNGLNSTVASHTSSISTVTTELGKVDGKINTAKSDAISTAGADATSKANNALNSAKSYTNAQITTVNTRVSNAESSINQLKDSITQKVWQTDIDKTVSEIEIGGRNLLLNSNFIFGKEGWNSHANNVTIEIVKDSIYGNVLKMTQLNDSTSGIFKQPTIAFKNEEVYTMSVLVKSSIAGSQIGIAIDNNGLQNGKIFTIDVANTWIRLVNTFKTSDINSNIRVYGTKSSGCIFHITNIKVEKGNKPTDWTPAPEDVDESILAVSKEVTTVKEKAASLETSLNSITSKVTNLESTTSTINGKVNSQETRLQSTEQKVTATGVITTITEAINAGTNSLTTMQFILDKNGATIKNGALRILNKAGKTVLSGDSDGNLTMTGDYVNLKDTGITALKIVDSTIKFYNWEVEGQVLGQIYSSRIINDNSKKGIGIGHNVKSYVHIGGKNEETGGYPSYIVFDRYNINGRKASQYYDSEIIVNGPTYFSAQVRLQSYVVVDNPFGCLRMTQSYLYGDGTIGKVLTSQITMPGGQTYGDVAILGRRGSNPNPNAYCVMGQLLSNSEYSYERTLVVSSSGVEINGNLRVTGTKNRLIETQNFGNLCLNAYETTGSWFGDLGRGIIDNTGVCYIYFDPKFIEAVNTNFDYNVFLQKYGQGDLWVEDKQHDYFVVKGTPNLKFAWEAKCKQRGYETDRLEETYEKCRAVNYIDEIPEDDESYLDGLKI